MKYIADHILLSPDETLPSLRRKVAEQLGVSTSGLRVSVIRKSWKRSKNGGFIEARVEAETNEFIHNTSFFSAEPERKFLETPKLKHPPVVIGFGLRGIIATYILAKKGLCPIALESGMSLSLRESRAKDRLSVPLNGEGGLPSCTGMLFTPDTLPLEVREMLEEEGIQFDTVNAHQYLTPNAMRGIVKKLHMAILEAGGQVYFEAQYLSTKRRFGKLRGVYFSLLGEKKFVKTSEVIIANGALDDTFYLGVAVESAQKTFNQVVYGKTLPDEKYPRYFLKSCFKTKQGDPCLIMCGLPNPSLLDVGSGREAMAHAFEFSGKNKNAVSYIATLTDRQSVEAIQLGSYITGSPSSVPCSTVSDFMLRRNPLRLAAIKPMNVSRIKLRDMNVLLGERIAAPIHHALEQLGRAFPFLLADESLVLGIVTLQGNKETDYPDLDAKGIHVTAILPENSLDFGSAATAGYRAVMALCAHAKKAH